VLPAGPAPATIASYTVFPSPSMVRRLPVSSQRVRGACVALA
jgi:hypothetical protein